MAAQAQQQAHLASILYQALGEPIGLLLTCSDEHKARQALYAARRAAGDPALDCLQIRMWPDGGLAIVRGKQAQSALEEL
jgi:hypothetical protein